MPDLSYLLKMDKTVVSVVDLSHDSGHDDVQYWLSKTPTERLIALETLRQQYYGYDPNTARFQRLFEVVEQAQS